MDMPDEWDKIIDSVSAADDGTFEVHRKDLMQFLEKVREEKVAEVFDHHRDVGLSGSCIINDGR
jgi:inorganic pyrophosphatase/exopolyphosphatase